jgi:hypothetical protein
MPPTVQRAYYEHSVSFNTPSSLEGGPASFCPLLLQCTEKLVVRVGVEKESRQFRQRAGGFLQFGRMTPRNPQDLAQLASCNQHKEAFWGWEGGGGGSPSSSPPDEGNQDNLRCCFLAALLAATSGGFADGDSRAVTARVSSKFGATARI